MPKRASAAAGCCLDEDRKAHRLGNFHRLGLVLHAAIRSRHDRDAEGLGGLLGLDLVTHGADVLGRRPDEGDVVLFQDLGEARVLRQESVAGVNRVSPRDLAGCQQARNVEIAFGGRRRADADALVGEADMHRVSVGRGVDRHRRDAEFLAGALYAQRDLSAVGDQNLVEHGLSRELGTGSRE